MKTSLRQSREKGPRNIMELVDRLRFVQGALGADRRLELWSELMAGYCRHCGYAEPSPGHCQCWNDE